MSCEDILLEMAFFAEEDNFSKCMIFMLCPFSFVLVLGSYSLKKQLSKYHSSQNKTTFQVYDFHVVSIFFHFGSVVFFCEETLFEKSFLRRPFLKKDALGILSISFLSSSVKTHFRNEDPGHVVGVRAEGRVFDLRKWCLCVSFRSVSASGGLI